MRHRRQIADCGFRPTPSGWAPFALAVPPAITRAGTQRNVPTKTRMLRGCAPSIYALILGWRSKRISATMTADYGWALKTSLLDFTARHRWTRSSARLVE